MKRYLGKGESVLVVDDIAEQREVAARLLTRLGYEVQAVSGGEEAVAYLKGEEGRHSGPRHDHGARDRRPGDLRRVLAINPKQKAIIVSGFSETDRVREAQELGAGAYVQKPYVMEKIGAAIRDELDRK